MAFYIPAFPFSPLALQNFADAAADVYNDEVIHEHLRDCKSSAWEGLRWLGTPLLRLKAYLVHQAIVALGLDQRADRLRTATRGIQVQIVGASSRGASAIEEGLADVAGREGSMPSVDDDEQTSTGDAPADAEGVGAR
jgi:hypothetical protein